MKSQEDAVASGMLLGDVVDVLLKASANSAREPAKRIPVPKNVVLRPKSEDSTVPSLLQFDSGR